ncbi:hypothetical protein H0G86_008025 [Trichoderma simmonsii]|uniref:Uncharacterized protein n=1 Tax=Trichoderma simmonsii TaxID=1491479 RepID=A0A8G0PFR3_9HYPO|nr:hypothetical protein H0G86_008025 [Trichoderma simmonsii]
MHLRPPVCCPSNTHPNKAGQSKSPALARIYLFRSRPGWWWLDRDHQIEIQPDCHHQPSIRPPSILPSPPHRRLIVTDLLPLCPSPSPSAVVQNGPAAGRPNRGLLSCRARGPAVGGAENAVELSTGNGATAP